MKSEERKTDFREGLRDGIPIFLGYISVSFTFGIKAVSGALTPLAAVVMSLTNVTSAGQFAGLGLIASCASLTETVLTMLLINLRYLLMSSALSQRISPDTTLPARLLVSFGVTDEVFGASMLRRLPLRASYMGGLIAAAVPGWVLGTALGAAAGSVLPAAVLRALNVALYAMFMGIILPPAKQQKALRVLIPLSMLFSLLFTHALPGISSGFRVIILTLALSAAAAIAAPVREEL